MDEASLRSLLAKVSANEISIDDAVEDLRFLPYADLGFAKVDHHRELRSSLAESVYGPGKTPTQVAAICKELVLRSSGAVLVTRADEDQYRAVANEFPEARFAPLSGMIVVRSSSQAPSGVVLVASAGTADQKPAEEAAVTAEALGLKVDILSDVGVAGLHRLLDNRDRVSGADVVIAVAGMEGALASLLGGLAPAPVIAVPTSVNYGAGAGGIATVLAMLNSCAPGVGVVNIDNGYGAAVLAAKILRTRQ